jgi:hypothetical protein
MNPALLIIRLPGFPPPMTSPSSFTRIKSDTVQREKARANGLTQKVPLFAGSLQEEQRAKGRHLESVYGKDVDIGFI